MATRLRHEQPYARRLANSKWREPCYGLDLNDGGKRCPKSHDEVVMTTKVHDALTEALDCVKASGLIRKYSLVWSGRSEVPRIIVWKAADSSDEALRHSLAESLAGLATESQVTIERE